MTFEERNAAFRARLRRWWGAYHVVFWVMQVILIGGATASMVAHWKDSPVTWPVYVVFGGWTLFPLWRLIHRRIERLQREHMAALLAELERPWG